MKDFLIRTIINVFSCNSMILTCSEYVVLKDNCKRLKQFRKRIDSTASNNCIIRKFTKDHINIFYWEWYKGGYSFQPIVKWRPPSRSIDYCLTTLCYFFFFQQILAIPSDLKASEHLISEIGWRRVAPTLFYLLFGSFHNFFI